VGGAARNRSLSARLDTLATRQQRQAHTTWTGRPISKEEFAVAMHELTADLTPEEAATFERHIAEAQRAVRTPSPRDPLGLSVLSDAQLEALERFARHRERAAMREGGTPV
jgi:hypothetical protein